MDNAYEQWNKEVEIGRKLNIPWQFHIHKFNSNSLDRLVIIPPSGEQPGNRLTQIK